MTRTVTIYWLDTGRVLAFGLSEHHLLRNDFSVYLDHLCTKQHVADLMGKALDQMGIGTVKIEQGMTYAEAYDMEAGR